MYAAHSRYLCLQAAGEYVLRYSSWWLPVVAAAVVAARVPDGRVQS